MAKNEKPIYEYDMDECKTSLKELDSEYNTLQTEFNNNTLKIVFGEPMEVPMTFNGKKTTVEEFVLMEEFEEFVNTTVENYGVICANLFKGGKVNDQKVKNMAKNMGISKNIFWKTVWKKAKMEYNRNKKETVEKRIEYLKKEEEKERKVGDK